MKFLFGRVEDIVGKGENASYYHFPQIPQFSYFWTIRDNGPKMAQSVSCV